MQLSTKNIRTFESSLTLAKNELINSVKSMAARGVATERLARAAVVVRWSDDVLERRIWGSQLNDGGWADVEESLWALRYLESIEAVADHRFSRGIKWIESQRSDTGGWGKTTRDNARIVTTALVLTLAGIKTNLKDLRWIEKEWQKDLSSGLALTYKGALVLLSFGQLNAAAPNQELMECTVGYLSKQQNADGGFGPWRNHPIGGDPWSTGICLAGLCSFPETVDKEVIERAVNWLHDTQLPSGLWPYHFIDEGSAYAYWGLKEALNVLSGD